MFADWELIPLQRLESIWICFLVPVLHVPLLVPLGREAAYAAAVEPLRLLLLFSCDFRLHFKFFNYNFDFGNPIKPKLTAS